MNVTTVRLLIGALTLCMLGCASDNVVEEQITDDHGVINVCGTGDGLTACPDLTMPQHETNKQLEKEADTINNDTPAQREKVIEAIEAGETP